jgi:hypothetical protein
MNKKVITAMMLGALVVSATSLTSCKDYDDDINNLQEQIDKAALKSDVEALKTQLATAQATADAAQKKAEANATDIAAVKDAAKTAGETAAKAVEAAAKAQSSADDAATVAKNAKELADAASKAAAANADAVAAIKKDLADAQAAIAKCATADELNKAITDAKADIEKTYATKADLNKTNEAVAKLQAESATAAALKDAVTKLEGEIAAAQPEGYKKLVETVASYKASINELYSALTGVELFATYTGSGLNVNGAKPTSLVMLHGIVGEDSKFGDNEAYKASDPIVAFVKGSEIAQNQGVIVKVNPVNVDLTKATVKLINSKGEVLDYVEAGTPEKYDYLITRAGNNVGGGLWKIPFKVKGADEEAFKKATQAEVNGQTKDILYAVAINNTDSAAERYVSSTYDVAPTYKKFAPLAKLDYKVNDKDVADIHNRWNERWNGFEAMTEDAVKFNGNLAELTWKDGKPATAATDKNTVKDQSDARWWNSPLHVEVNQAFNIKVNNTEAKYYYVTLDKDFAIESAPSEWNAWSNYSYEGLFKTTPADSTLSLKITSEAANGDIIGFRVFAVNADGTLQDPDGRAFYVQVGEAANTESVTGNDTITTANAAIYSAADLEDANKVNVVDMPLTKSFQSSTSNLSGVLNLDDATKGNLLGGESAYYILLDKDKKPAADWKDAKYVRVGVNNGGNWKDGTQISGTIKAVKDGNPTSAEVTLNTLVVTVKKVLPTTANYKLTFRGVQEDVKGTGKFTLYMLPANGWAATTTSETGSANLDNTFYNLPNNITFTIADAAWKDKAKGQKEANVVTDKNLVEGVDFIDGGDYHKMVAAVNFGKISTATVDKDGNMVDYTLDIDQNLEVKFACWEMANTYSWVTKKVNNKQVSAKPSIMWNAAGNYANIVLSTDVDVKNSYDPNRFSGKLSNLIGTNKYLTIVEGSAHFYYGEQKDPYFEPTIAADGTVTINKTQVENAPTTDHEETLSFKVKDCYGHEKTLTLPVTVLRPAKK